MPQRLPATKTPRRFPLQSFCADRGSPQRCRSFYAGRSVPVVLCRSVPVGGPPNGAGRGLNPRPERSTHAKAGEQRLESRNQKIHFGECLSAFGIAGEHLAGVELSGRRFNPRPPQPDRHRNHPRKKTSKKRRNPPAKRYNVTNGRSQREKVRKKFRVRPPSNPTENFKGGIPP